MYARVGFGAYSARPAFLPAFRPRRRLTIAGLGAVDPGIQQAASVAAQGAATTGVILSSLASPSIAALSPAFAAAGPIGLAVAGLTALGFAIANVFSGCGETCVAATQIANQVGDYLTQNRDTYLNSPQRFKSMQAAALNNFDTAAAAMRQACGNPQLGDAGQRCISERLVKGAPAPWCPTPDHTGCDWVTVLRDPIANDPGVLPDPSPADQGAATILSAVGVSPSTTVAGFSLSSLLLPVGLLFAAFALGGRD